MYNLPAKKDYGSYAKKSLLIFLLLIIALITANIFGLLPKLALFTNLSQNLKALLVALSLFIIFSIIAIYMQVSKKVTSYDIHGSARWANEEEIRKTGLLDNER